MRSKTLSFCLRDWRNVPLCPFGTRLNEILRSAVRLQFPTFRSPERFTPSVGRSRPSSATITQHLLIVYDSTYPFQKSNVWRKFFKKLFSPNFPRFSSIFHSVPPLFLHFFTKKRWIFYPLYDIIIILGELCGARVLIG